MPVVISKLNPAILKPYAKKAGIDIKQPIEDIAREFENRELKKPQEKVLKCDVCDGFADESYPDCPYCGSADVAPDAKPNASAVEEFDDEPEVVPDEDVEPAPEPAPESKKTTRKTPAHPGAKASNGDKPAKGAKGTTVVDPTERTVKASDKELVEKIQKKKPAEVAPVAHDGEVLTEKSLDQAIKRIRDAERRGAIELFTVCENLVEIERRGLYALRLGKDKRPVYTNFTQFVREELKMTPQYARKLADIARQFSAEDMRQAGPAKLAILVGLKPSDERDKLLEAAKSGVTREQIIEDVKKLGDDQRAGARRTGYQFGEGGTRKGEVDPNKWRKDKAERDAKADEDIPRSDELITVINPTTRTLVFIDRDGNPAKTLRKGPVAVEVSANGVKSRYELVLSGDGELSLKILQVREEA